MSVHTIIVAKPTAMHFLSHFTVHSSSTLTETHLTVTKHISKLDPVPIYWKAAV